jgi:NAD(P)-dependent dehydrogenase (short-subunit alcohol dehydrogenase family)
LEYVQCDLSNPALVDRMWRGVRERHGQVNVLINNAARSMGRRISELKFEDVRKTIEINFLSIV